MLCLVNNPSPNKNDKLQTMAKKDKITLEEQLWSVADKLRADSGLKASQYSTPVLGLIFLRFVSIKYDKYKAEIEDEYQKSLGGRNTKKIEDIAMAKVGYYLPDNAHFDYLLSLPESENIPKAIKEAMESIEHYKPELVGSLPKDEYLELVSSNSEGDNDSSLAKQLLKNISNIPADITGDVFGKVYEYFLGKFALKEGQGGGEFFTPTSVVRLMVEMIEPYGGLILDPACGSGGMFVQSADFVKERRKMYKDTEAHELVVHGIEKEKETVKIARMNMFLNGLRSEIVNANSYYDDPFDTYGRFDYVMANPPFNVKDVNLDKIKCQQRFSEYGIPQNKTKKSVKKDEELQTVPSANYLWINLFATALKDKGRAALVMPNLASDARNTEADIRQRLIESGIISGMLSLPRNMFYTVTLPATLWFFDKARTEDKRILFIDARNIFRQIDRAHREFTTEQIHNIACIRHLYQGDTDYMVRLLAKYDEDIAKLEKAYAEAEARCSEAKSKADAWLADNEGKRLLPALNKELQESEEDLNDTKAEVEYMKSQRQWLTDRFPDGVYTDVIGLCKAASLDEIKEQDYSLNPGRYVGVVIEEDGLTAEEFKAEMKSRHDELVALNSKAKEVMNMIEDNMKSLFE